MPDPVTDPLALGQRVVAILQLGRRTATYKLATLMALMDHCLEHLPDDLEAELPVPVKELAERVLEIYWHQVLPFEGEALKQTTQPIAAILRDTVRLRAAANVGDQRLALAVARLRAPVDYDTAVNAIGMTLARQPLQRLQRIGGHAGPASCTTTPGCATTSPPCDWPPTAARLNFIRESLGHSLGYPDY